MAGTLCLSWRYLSHKGEVLEVKLEMTDKVYNTSAEMLMDRMPELNYRYSSSMNNEFLSDMVYS